MSALSLKDRVHGYGLCDVGSIPTGRIGVLFMLRKNYSSY